MSFNIKILQHPDYGPIVRALLQEIENPDSGLPSTLKEQWFQAISDFSNDPDPEKLVELTKWRRSIVPIDEFLFSKDYLGLDEKQTFPAVLEACHELDTDKYTEAVLLGSIGCGKCLKEDTLIPTTYGLLPIGTLYKRFHEDGVRFKVLSETGLRDAVNVIHNGKVPTKKVTFASGRVVEGTGKHRLRFIRNGQIQWVMLKDVVSGDKSLMTRNLHPFGQRHYSENVAYMLGYATGDGSISYSGDTPCALYISVCSDLPNIMAKLSAGVTEFFGKCSTMRGRPLKTRDGYLMTLAGHSRDLCKKLLSAGFNRGAANKEILDFIMESDMETTSAFLKGLFDADGTVCKNGHVYYTTKSPKLCKQLCSLLSLFGINYTIRDKERFIGDKSYGIFKELLITNADSAILFNKYIGFDEPNKARRLAKRIAEITKEGYGRNDKMVAPDVGLILRTMYSVKPFELPKKMHHLKSFKKQPNYSLRQLRKLYTYQKEWVDQNSYLRFLCTNNVFFDTVVKVEDSFADTYDIEVKDDHSYCFGGFISHNTSLSNYMILRTIYKISCMRQPQLTFGLQPKSAIVLTIQSVKLSTAKKAVFEELGALIDNSTYFRNIYPYDGRIKSQLIFRENRVSILPVTSSISGAISMNVIAGVLDEANFMQKIKNSKSANADDSGMYDQAKQLYNTLARRRKSRFNKKGKLPGTLFVVSSSRYPDDFTQLKAKESTAWGGKDPTIFVYNKSQWEAKGRDRFMDESFRVQVGNAYVSPKILGPNEQPTHNSQVIEVPMDFYAEFEKDCSGALRDYAGVTVLSSSPYFTRRETINQCMEFADKMQYKPIFNTEVLDLSMGIPRPFVNRLRLDVDQPRACHIDLGLKKDACGLCIGHIAGSKLIERVDPLTKIKNVEILPLIGIDLSIRIVPPPGGEIEFSNIRRLITMLRDEYGLPIKYITTDGFQSVDTRQILRKQGFFCDYLSVEKIEPYRTFRDAIYDNRVIIPQNDSLKQELVRLERVFVGNRERVDHPANFHKDMADAVCGVCNFLLTRRASWTTMEINPNTGMCFLGDPQFNAEVKHDYSGSGYAIGNAIIRKTLKRKTILRKNPVRA